mmetsp:Transcript_9126/g.8723  ORF Transcript_9126/g.8723 Transcript_9126/m.8723 type:complete len:211 (+) Transcript_9126:1935-2567(+)
MVSTLSGIASLLKASLYSESLFERVFVMFASEIIISCIKKVTFITSWLSPIYVLSGKKSKVTVFVLPFRSVSNFLLNLYTFLSPVISILNNLSGSLSMKITFSVQLMVILEMVTDPILHVKGASLVFDGDIFGASTQFPRSLSIFPGISVHIFHFPASSKNPLAQDLQFILVLAIQPFHEESHLCQAPRFTYSSSRHWISMHFLSVGFQT